MPATSPHVEGGYRIGDAAQQSGVSAANIRYYEKEGLLAPQARAGNDYRIYTAADVHQLLSVADQGLYEAKNRGRNRVHCVQVQVAGSA